MKDELFDIDGVGAVFTEQEDRVSVRYTVERHPTAVMSELLSRLRSHDRIEHAKMNNNVEVEVLVFK